MDTEQACIPEFGEKKADCGYQQRPGAYAVLFDSERRVAILQTRRGCFLPGGGSEPGETPEQTLHREVQEECGCAILIGRILGEAVEFVYAAEEETYFQKHGTFFEAMLDGKRGAGSQEDHTLLWVTPGEAVERLTHQSQAWAIREALRRD